MYREASPAAPQAFSEREFYLREFRGRTLAFAVPEDARLALVALGPAFDALAAGGARVVVVAPDPAALEKAFPGRVVALDHHTIEGEVWRRLGERPWLGVSAPDSRGFASRCREFVLRLGLFKLLWIDSRGGLRTREGARQSFVHLNELGALLEKGGVGLATPKRIALWREVAAMLDAGVPAVNVCSAEEAEEELFTYAGRGTLFTRERYVAVRRLGVDDYDAAWDLISRGVEEGYLAPRGQEEVDAVLASGFGAFVEGRHLAGIGALLPGADGCSGEIASLYTLTRFLGEGVGVSLVAFALTRARELGHDYVYACTTSQRVGAFFERNGFGEVGQDAVPAERWHGYDPARRQRVRCYRADLRGTQGDVPN
jgi:amino-acid N-acetyltransferase